MTGAASRRRRTGPHPRRDLSGGLPDRTRDTVGGVPPLIRIDVLQLGSVVLPEQHPRAADGRCVIQGFAIHHPDGVFLVDTGVATDHDLLNELYRPTVVPIVEAVNAAGVDERDVVAIVNSHLHFDHCGQNRFLPDVPVYAQRAEWEAAELPRFTIPEWALIDASRRRLLDGDEEIAPGLRVVATPGHTPGHQSVLIDGGPDGPTLVAAQACYTCAEFAAGAPAAVDMHDETWLDAGIDSLRRLWALHPAVAHFSHDPTVYESPPHPSA